MKKVKLIKQRILFELDEKITRENRTEELIIECDYYKLNNLRHYNYPIVDSISFFIDDIEVERHYVLCDKYYKLYDSNLNLISKHNYGN